MLRDSRSVIIVDGYSTARELVAELARISVPCLHLRSVEVPPERLLASFSAEAYCQDLGYLGTFNEAARELSGQVPCAIVAGSEPGVEFAESLAALMRLPCNDMAVAKARRNKYEMGKVITAAGLRCAKQKLVRSNEEACILASDCEHWPVVIKPLNSAGSDGVSVCYKKQDVLAAVNRILHRQNLLGLGNEALLMQSWLDGQQFIVNTVSREGFHSVTDVWRMNMRPVPGFANAMEDLVLADPLKPDVKELIDYALAAISALGMRNGAAHTELRATSKGPALIETGARLMGPTIERAPYLAAALNGTQASSLAESIVKPDTFFRALKAKPCYEYRRAFAKVFFIFKGAGTIVGISGLEQLKTLPSFFSMYRPLSIGDRVILTTDTTGHGGVIYLIHDDPEQVERDRHIIREMNDENRLYTVAYDDAA